MTRKFGFSSIETRYGVDEPGYEPPPEPQVQSSLDAGSRELPELVLEPFPTADAYLRRLFEHPMYGSVPSRGVEAFKRLGTRDPEERLLTGRWLRHGATETGLLMVTTHWLRYVKQGRLFTVIEDDDFWPLDGSLELQAHLASVPVFRTSDGKQFQIAPAVPLVSRREAKEFLEIYRLATLATLHLDGRRGQAGDGETVDAAKAAERPASTVADLKDLVALKDAGHLTEAEFSAAKERLLFS